MAASAYPPSPKRKPIMGHLMEFRRDPLGFLLEGGGSFFQEVLLPAVEDRGLQAEFIAELRDRLVLQQMSPDDGDLSSGV